MRFSLILWLLSLTIFLPLMGGGFFGMSTGAGPLPIVGNLILHLVYGAVLGTSYAEATEDWLDDTEVDRLNAAAAERGAAGGILVGVVAGLIAGWESSPRLFPTWRIALWSLSALPSSAGPSGWPAVPLPVWGGPLATRYALIVRH